MLRALGLPLALLAALAVYAPSLRNGFALDGRTLVMVEGNPAPNPMVAELHGIRDYFGSHYWHGAGMASDLYRPVTILSYALVYAALGQPLGAEAFAQHAVDLLLHLLAVALVYRLVRALGAGVGAAAVAALVFAVHGVHSEAVVGGAGRADLLAFCCGAGALLVGLGARPSLARPSLARPSLARPSLAHPSLAAPALARAALAALLFFVAFGAKESAAAWLPFTAAFALARASAARDPSPVRAALRACAPAVAGGALAFAAFLGLRAGALASVDGAPQVLHLVNPLHDAAPWTRVRTALVVWVHALRLTLLPSGLVSDYGMDTFALRETAGDPAVWGALAALAIPLALALLGWRRRPMLFAAAAAFHGFSFVTANVAFPTGTILGERLLYAPSLGLSLAVAWLAARGRAPSLLAVVIGTWCLWNAAVIVERNPHWASNEALFRRDVEVNPRSAFLQQNAAAVYRARRDLDAATLYQRRATELAPDYAGAWNNLAAYLLEKGELAAAERSARRGLQARWVQAGQDREWLHLNLAAVLRAARREREALDVLRQGVAEQPRHAPTWCVLLDAADGRADDRELEQLVAGAEAALPDQPRWAFHRGRLARRRGDLDTAEQELRFAAAGEPGNAFARLELGQVLVARGEVDEARACLEGLLAPGVPREVRVRAEVELRAVR